MNCSTMCGIVSNGQFLHGHGCPNRGMKIVLTTEALVASDLEKIRQLFKDALGEFIASRGPTPAEYVARRYDWSYSLQAREAKIAEVAFRCALAEKLRHAVEDVEVES